MALLEAGTLDALNQHIQQELASGHEYLAASAHFSMTGMEGMATWMRHQADEERAHAMRFYDHVLQRDGAVRLYDIPAPPQEYADALDVFRQALEREERTTRHINKLYEFAVEHKDFALKIFLQWFIEEQVREEDSLRNILQRLELIGDDKAALVMLDRDLGQREAPGAA